MNARTGFERFHFVLFWLAQEPVTAYVIPESDEIASDFRQYRRFIRAMLEPNRALSLIRSFIRFVVHRVISPLKCERI